MKNLSRVLSLFLIVVSAFSCGRGLQNSSQWHHPLYNGNNDYWRQRVPVNIRNNTHREILGDIVEIKIGNGNGQAHLAGVLAEGIRVTNSRGNQLMYRIADTDGKLIEKGPIPDQSKITIPVECRADSQAINYIYYDNPSAWPVGDYLKATEKINDSLSTIVEKKEKILLKNKGETETWFNDESSEPGNWQTRAAIRTINYSHKKSTGTLLCVGVEGLLNRLHAEISKPATFQVTDGIKPIPYYRLGNNILFIQEIPGMTEQTNYLYFNSENKSGSSAKAAELKDLKSFNMNLIRNPDFESKDLMGWKGINGIGNIQVSPQGREGAGSVQVQIEAGSGVNEIGLEQTLPVQGSKLYLFSSWIKCSDRIDQSDFNRTIRERTIRAQFIGKDGKPAGRLNRVAVNPDVHIDNEWSQLFMLINAPENADSVKLQLVNSAPGSVWYDDVLFMNVLSGETSPMAIERKTAKDLKELTVWQQDPIVKVFNDDLPPRNIGEFSISAARNEYEPLQLVIRSPQAYKQIQVKVIAPADQNGNKLDKIDVGVLGYVPIDYPSNYMNDRVSPAWYQKIPFGNFGSDGWAGMWPDPILPFNTFDLEPYKTQPVWIEFKVPGDAVPGNYTGQVQLINNEQVIKEVQFKVHIWNFRLSDNSHVTAEFDLRSRSDTARKELMQMYATHRIAPDHILPAPTWKNENGRIIFDFTEYDKAATYYFDTLKYITTYSPQYFYLFGWANPPAPKFGEKPYNGDSPYQGVDRSKLRPEFKKVFQSAVKGYWNHMKEKGWSDKVVFYISDEPHALPEITAQMRALCDMIHEVDHKIPIYVSCWSYRPEYIGYVNVWGVSNHRGPVEDLLKIKQTGDRLYYTTDGKMCTDTPYLGYERMLPYFCFKYGAEEYEFWASNWYTYNPYDYGWHRFNRESQVPGQYAWTRYPNGDGYLFYPGKPIGVKSLVPSIRLKLIREGVEDFEYLYYLDSLISQAKKLGKDTNQAQKAIDGATALVTIPSDEGRYSTRNLPDPYAVLRARELVAKAIEELMK